METCPYSQYKVKVNVKTFQFIFLIAGRAQNYNKIRENQYGRQSSAII